jgi:ABC-type bacteriocin/lantibiotic exporter with double-glycine peptidase domain
MIPIFTAAIITNVMLTRKLTARQRELAAEATGFAQERLGNLLTVHAFTAEEVDEEGYAKLLDEAHALAAKVDIYVCFVCMCVCVCIYGGGKR